MAAGILAQSARGIPWDAGSVPGMGAFQVDQGVHFDCTDPATLFSDSVTLSTVGGSVATIRDKTTNARHANAFSTAPTRTVSPIPGVQFNGSNTLMRYDGTFIAGSSYTAIALITRGSGKTNNFFFGSNVNTLRAGYPSSTTLRVSQNTLDLMTAVPSFSVPLSDLVVYDSNISVGKSLYLNGVLVSSSTDKTTLSSYVSAGLGRATNYYFNGLIHLFILLPSAINEENRNRIEWFMFSKTGEVSKLPSNNRYRQLFPGRFLP